MTDEPHKPLSVDPQAETPAEAQAPASGSSAASSTGASLGGRVRRTTQKFTFAQAKGDEPEEFAPPAGKGVKVRDMEFVCGNVEALGKKQQDMIKQLYSVMYGRRFQQKNMKLIKEHILDFSGVIEQDEKSREHLFAKMGKWKRIFVHEVMDLLAVDRSKKSFDEAGKPHDKEALIDRLIDWLYNPQETKLGEKKAAIAAKKEKQKANKRAKKAKKASESEPAKKKRKTTKKKAAVADEEEDEENDHESTESEGEESSSDFEEGDKKPTKKRKATRRPKKSRVVESDDEDDDEGEKDNNAAADKDEEQPAAEPEEESAVAKKEEPETEPLDADVCSKVRDIIAHGNAEELTVKKIVRQLSADLGRDMSSQKKAIKEFITNDQAEI
ncbi:protein dek [Phytophthora cinnamomi]|uniref:protein dek n=1 Tax=Phytophthora cinnamomi TaxID=4785 RepID=UPI00355A96F1|nr:protein dek [Phytophthora cinnamomi]